MAILAVVGLILSVFAAEVCFLPATLRTVYDDGHACPLGVAASSLSFALTWIINVLLCRFYYMRTVHRMTVLHYKDFWPAFWNSAYPWLLCTELLVCNLQPFPDPAFRYTPGIRSTFLCQ
jgi:hypothetical protein